MIAELAICDPKAREHSGTQFPPMPSFLFFPSLCLLHLSIIYFILSILLLSSPFFFYRIFCVSISLSFSPLSMLLSCSFPPSFLPPSPSFRILSFSLSLFHSLHLLLSPPSSPPLLSNSFSLSLLSSLLPTLLLSLTLSLLLILPLLSFSLYHSLISISLPSSLLPAVRRGPPVRCGGHCSQTRTE